MKRARVVKDEFIEQDTRFLAIYLETRNSCLVLLSENEDRLGTVAISVPKPEDTFALPPSSVLLGDRNTISARLIAEYLASNKNKIALASVYLQTVDETQAQSLLMKLLKRVIRKDQVKEGATV